MKALLIILSMAITYLPVLVFVIYAIAKRRKSEPKEWDNVENHEI